MSENDDKKTKRKKHDKGNEPRLFECMLSSNLRHDTVVKSSLRIQASEEAIKTKEKKRKNNQKS